MHRSSGKPDVDATSAYSISWEDSKGVDDWLKTQPVDTWKQQFEQDGVLVVRNLLEVHGIAKYLDLYEKMMSGEIDTSAYRHDLGNQDPQREEGKENICQIMWPSLFVANIFKGPLHERTKAVARTLLGPDIEFDFDMLISKAPRTDTPTPWHQDESYWLDMPDKRAVSCWCALDESTLDNGCMWFVPGSHKLPIRKHRPVKPGVHVLCSDGSEDEGKPFPLAPGSCTFHSGRTVHYSRGNTTESNRRAYITNYRPKAMIEYERANDYDHGKKGLTGLLGTGRTHKMASEEDAGQ